MKSLIELQKNIDEKKKILNLSVENDEPQDVLYQKSVDTDEAIAEYMKAVQYYKAEREKIINLHGDIINTPFKDEIINQIESDVLKRYPNISRKELKHFSTNVYIYAILIANNVDKFKLVAVINNLNCIYAEEWQEDGVVQDSLIHEVNTDFYRDLNKKYLEIVKEKLK